MNRAVATAVVATAAQAQLGSYLGSTRGRTYGVDYLAKQTNPYALHDSRYGYVKSYDGLVVDDFYNDELEKYPTIKHTFPGKDYKTKTYNQVYSYDPERLYIGYGGKYKDGAYLTRRTHHVDKIDYQPTAAYKKVVADRKRDLPKLGVKRTVTKLYGKPLDKKLVKQAVARPYATPTKFVSKTPYRPVRSYKPAIKKAPIAAYKSPVAYKQPVRKVGYSAPKPTVGYGAPKRTVGYGAPKRTVGYGAPKRTVGYGAPKPTVGYGVPQRTTGYGVAGPYQGPVGYGPRPQYVDEGEPQYNLW